jgi:ubiquinone/menaquinone biosynthesis C-methylase UbiE
VRGRAGVSHPPTDYESLAGVYDEGRALPLDQIGEWQAVLRDYLGEGGLRVLDLGSGTGLFTEALLSWFDVGVIGVEPSDAMRRRAASKSLAGASYIGGEAERIPLRPNSVDCAWLSTVLHHIRDRARCAHELRRVLTDGGPVLIRNSFGDRLDNVGWLRYFPTARRLASQRWPTVAETAAAFATAGFAVEALHSVPEVIAPNLNAYYERIAVRANSTLTLIDDHAFEDGIERLRQEASSDSGTDPVVDRRDLLVLR